MKVLPQGVYARNERGDAVQAHVYDFSKDGSGRLDLLIPTVDTQSNEVRWRHRSQQREGIDWVHLDQDPNSIGQPPTREVEAPPDTSSTEDAGSNRPEGEPEPAPTQFDVRDTNKDGVVSKEENKAFKREQKENQ